jgi:hypothetical protein
MLKTQDRPDQITAAPEVPSISSTSMSQQNDGGSPVPCSDSGFENTFHSFPPATSHHGGGSWEMIGLGLEEPLPTQDAVNEL